MAARQQFQRSSNSSHSSHFSHPSSQFRDKSKYNNTRGGSNTRSEGKPNRGENGENAVVSQEELTQFLVSKLRDNRFVEVTTNEIKNDRGTLFEIDVKNGGLFRIGNGTFFSLKLHTVSHKSRVIFVTIVFNREVVNEERIRINSDSIIQIFRELAPNTIDKISIQHLGENKPLAVVVSTIKGASLNYTYERALEFIHVVDEKYGSDAGASQNADASAGAVVGDSTNPEEMTPDQIDLEAAMLEKKIKALKAIKASKSSANAGASPSAMPGEDETTTSTPAPAAKAASAPSSRSSSPTKFRIMVGDKKMN
jgi:hypothetical protein